VGLASQGNATAQAALQAKLVSAKADDPQYSALVLQALSANGSLILGLTSASLSRVRATLSKQIDEVTAALNESRLLHPITTLRSIAKAMPDPNFVSTFQPELTKIIEKRPHSIGLLKLITDRPSLIPLYFPVVLAKAGSGDFATANAMANALESLDGGLAALFTDEQTFQLIVAVLKAADWNAFGAQGLKNSKFAGVPALRQKVIAYVVNHPSEAEHYIAAKLDSTDLAADFVEKYLADEAEA